MLSIQSVGLYVPPEVRTNDWWPSDTVNRWRERAPIFLANLERAAGDDPTPGQRACLAAFRELIDDPFLGAKERRLMPQDMKSSDMEILAARDAIERAGIRPDQVDVILSNSMLPDFQTCNQACIIHDALALRPDCFTLAIEGVCSSFPMQLWLMNQLFAAGSARVGLLVQSCATSRLMPFDEPYSAWAGDAATAMVVTPPKQSRGLLGARFLTDGSFHRSFVNGIPNHTWYDDGRIISYSADPEASRKMMLSTADAASEVMQPLLREAGLTPDDIDFYACHQPTAWVRPVTQEFLGLSAARSLDTFAWAGTVSASNLGLQLGTAEREGMLRAGDRVAMFSVGSGQTTCAVALEWGG